MPDRPSPQIPDLAVDAAADDLLGMADPTGERYATRAVVTNPGIARDAAERALSAAAPALYRHWAEERVEAVARAIHRATGRNDSAPDPDDVAEARAALGLEGEGEDG